MAVSIEHRILSTIVFVLPRDFLLLFEIRRQKNFRPARYRGLSGAVFQCGLPE